MAVLGDLLNKNAMEWPEKRALVFNDRALTWAEVNERVNRLSHGFLSLGLSKGDRVGILSENRPEWIETAFALGKSGLICVPLNTRLTVPELTHIANDSGLRVVVASPSMLKTARQLVDAVSAASVRCLVMGGDQDLEDNLEDLMVGQPSSEPAIAVTGSDLFMLCYTSGTTGKPKGAMLSHANHVAAATIQSSEMRLRPAYVCLLNLPLFFIGGWGGNFLPAAIRGCTVVITEFEPGRVLQLVEQEKINFTVWVPTMVNILLNYPRVREFDVTSLKMVVCAASPMPVVQLRKAIDIFGKVFLSIYGMTETSPSGTCLQLEDVDPDGTPEQIERLASVGKGMVTLLAKVVRPDMTDVIPGSGEVGEVVIKGDTVMQGYWNQPEETQRSLRDGWFLTGDLAIQDEEKYIYIVDRKKDMIITGGINVYSREVEEVLSQCPGVLECAVIGVPSERWGEEVWAIVAPKPGVAFSNEELHSFCSARLGSYKVPKVFEVIDGLPKNASGKILKRELREKYWVDRSKRVN